MTNKVTYDGNHPDHDVGEERNPQHTDEERDQVPIPPFLQATIGHGVMAGDTQRKTRGPREQLPSITLGYFKQRYLLLFCHFVHSQRST